MMLMMMMKVQLAQTQYAIKDKELQIKAATSAMQQQGLEADRASNERIEVLKQQVARMKDSEDLIVQRLKLNGDMIIHAHTMLKEHQQSQLDNRRDNDLHQQTLAQKDEQHQQRMGQSDDMHQQRMTAQRETGQGPAGANGPGGATMPQPGNP
jgi:hypothetical protein